MRLLTKIILLIATLIMQLIMGYAYAARFNHTKLIAAQATALPI
ncbi:hypothetical protein ACL9RF_13995 [Sphingobacterium sp. Mn56C]